MSGTASKADTFLISCIDPRFTDDTTFRFAALGRTDRYSEMRIAGAALALVDDNRPSWQTALWENLAASIQLHGIRNVTLLNHADCGAMDIWAGRRLRDDPAEELRLHREVLNRAADAIRARHPDLLIELKFMEKDGSVTRPACRSCIPAGFRAGPSGLDNLPTLVPEGTAPPGPAERFGALARLRSRGGPLDAEAELRLLSEGVGGAGLSAVAAREALRTAQGAQPSAAAIERDVTSWLQTRADRRGRVGPRDLLEAAGLNRRLQGQTITPEAARRQVAQWAERAGLEPRPTGIWPLRSTRWFTRSG